MSTPLKIERCRPPFTLEKIFDWKRRSQSIKHRQLRSKSIQQSIVHNAKQAGQDYETLKAWRKDEQWQQLTGKKKKNRDRSTSASRHILTPLVRQRVDRWTELTNCSFFDQLEPQDLLQIFWIVSETRFGFRILHFWRKNIYFAVFQTVWSLLYGSMSFIPSRRVAQTSPYASISVLSVYKLYILVRSPELKRRFFCSY